MDRRKDVFGGTILRQTFSKKRTQTLTDNAEYTLWSTMKTKTNDLFLK